MRLWSCREFNAYALGPDQGCWLYFWKRLWMTCGLFGWSGSHGFGQLGCQGGRIWPLRIRSCKVFSAFALGVFRIESWIDGFMIVRLRISWCGECKSFQTCLNMSGHFVIVPLPLHVEQFSFKTSHLLTSPSPLHMKHCIWTRGFLQTRQFSLVDNKNNF